MQIPADDGGHANDWFLRIPSRIPLTGEMAAGPVQTWDMIYRIEDYSGSGSNAWSLDFYVSPNLSDFRDDWSLWRPPEYPWGLVHPFTFDQSDLTVESLHRVPRRLFACPWGIMFTRSGTGNHVLDVTVWIRRSEF